MGHITRTRLLLMIHEDMTAQRYTQLQTYLSEDHPKSQTLIEVHVRGQNLMPSLHVIDFSNGDDSAKLNLEIL